MGRHGHQPGTARCSGATSHLRCLRFRGFIVQMLARVKFFIFWSFAVIFVELLSVRTWMCNFCVFLEGGGRRDPRLLAFTVLVSALPEASGAMRRSLLVTLAESVS